jgi:hypothetical protein
VETPPVSSGGSSSTTPAGPPAVTIDANLQTPLLRSANSIATLGAADGRQVAVDGTNLYYIDGNDGAFGAQGAALRAQPLGGGASTLLATAVVVAFDRVGTDLYFATATTIDQVATTGGASTPVIVGQTAIRALAADLTHVYYLDAGTGIGQGALKSVPVGGGGVTTLATGFQDPAALVINGTHAYVADRGTGNNGTVKAIPLVGGPAVTLASNQPAPAGLTVDGTHVYFANAPLAGGGDLRKVPMAGGSVTMLVTGLAAPSPRLAVDATHLYYLDGNAVGATATAGSVRRVPLAGGDPFLMATGLNRPLGLALDGTTVYFSVPSSVSTLQKIAK